VLLALASANAGMSLRCVEPMLPKLVSDFDTSVSAAAAIVSGFALGYTLAVLLQGPLGDRFGKLRVVTIAMALAGLASLASAGAWDVASLAALRFMTGALASASVPLGMAYIGDVVPMQDRQKTIARFIAGSLLGQAVGPLFGGVFIDWLSWRQAFAALGAVFMCVSAILFVRTSPHWPAVTAGAFRPLATHRRLLGRPAVRWLAATGVVETFFFFGAYVFLGTYFKQRLDLSFTTIGVILAGFGIGGLIYSSAITVLLRVLRERELVTAGGMLAALLFGLVVMAPSWAYALPCTLGLGLAFYLVHNTIQTKATEVAPEARGSAVAIYASAFGFGQGAGAAAMGLAVSFFDLASMIAVFGIGFLALSLWLRDNLGRLRP
jgi:MFS transporter, YNFM family, putative membrane transport protein